MAGNPREHVKNRGFWDGGDPARGVNNESGGRTSGLPGDVNVSANSTNVTFHKSVTGADAGFSLDGIPLASTTNTVSAPLPGVTLNLLGASPGTPVTISVAPVTAGITQAINDFVSAYNSAINANNGISSIDTAQAALDSQAISNDGRFVTYTSDATNLVTGFVQGSASHPNNVYLFDRATGTNLQLSRTSASAMTRGRSADLTSIYPWHCSRSATSSVCGLASRCLLAP